MKIRNIKKYYKTKITNGWRSYLDLKVPYDKIGVTNQFLSIEDIERIMNLKRSGEDSGFVGEYYMYDYSKLHNDIPKTVKVRTNHSYIPKDWTVEQYIERYELPSNLLYIYDKHSIYYIDGIEGYRNPDYNIDDDYNSDKPYWLFEDDDNLKMSHWALCKDNESEIEILERFVNSVNFLSNIMSGNLIYSLLSGNVNINPNLLLHDLADLANLTKTVYTEFKKDYVIITYAIRYDDYIDKFLTKLKRIIINHKIKKF